MAIPTVTITSASRLLAPDGAGIVSGIVVAKLSQPASALDGAVSQRVSGEVQATITAGVLGTFALVPNDCLTPTGTYYEVTFYVTLVSGRPIQWSEKWQLSSSPSSIDVGAVPRLDVVPGVAVSVSADVAAAAAVSAAAASASAASAAAAAAAVSAAAVPGSATLVRADGSTTDRPLGARAADEINVLDQGADPTGATYSDAAFTAAIQLAVRAAAPNATVFIPPGTYKFSTSGVFSNTGRTATSGVHFRGSGMQSTILRWVPSGSDLWIYDNGATARMQFATFSDVWFQGPSFNGTQAGVSANAKGFKITSSSWDQGFKFNRVQWTGFANLFDLEGTATASEMTFHDCLMSQISGSVFYLNNPQSVNHEFYGLSITTFWGNLVEIGPNGGGNVKFFGGNVVMNSPTSGRADIIKVAGTGTGSSNAVSSFHGTRFELFGATTGIVYARTGGQGYYTFRDCTWVDTGEAAKDVVNFQGTMYVLIDGGSIVSSYTYRWGGADVWPWNATLEFRSVMNVSVDTTAKATAEGYLAGRMIASGCLYSAGTSVNAREASDFDFPVTLQAGAFGSEGGNANMVTRVKVAHFKPSHYSFPHVSGGTGSSESTILLPANAVIKNIFIRKPAQGASTLAVQYKAGTNDKGVTYGASVSANENAAHIIDATNLMVKVGTATNTRTVRLWVESAGSATENQPLGVAIVEYY